MGNQVLVNVMSFYGIFLITCGMVSVIFIGFKAKTALISGGISGSLSLLIAYFIFLKTSGAQFAGLFLTLSLFIVFAWRSTKTLFRIFEMIAKTHADLKEKGIAFLIISLMAVMSVFVFAFQIAFY
jgi:hypothetical protein